MIILILILINMMITMQGWVWAVSFDNLYTATQQVGAQHKMKKDSECILNYMLCF